jgi:hypothetical protein
MTSTNGCCRSSKQQTQPTQQTTQWVVPPIVQAQRTLVTAPAPTATKVCKATRVRVKATKVRVKATRVCKATRVRAKAAKAGCPILVERLRFLHVEAQRALVAAPAGLTYTDRVMLISTLINWLDLTPAVWVK